MSEMLYNPYDLIIIQKNIIPQEHIEEIMLLANDKNTSQATIIDTGKGTELKDDDKQHKSELSDRTDLEVRNTIWYNITVKMAKNLEQAVAECFRNFVIPKYKCEFKSYDPVQFLGYPVGGHYKEHNDSEHYDFQNRKWVQSMNRDVSFLFYLNEEFGGGELEFVDLGLTIKPKKGMMIAFPSYKEFAHKVHPVTWGHRYTLVSWVETQKNLYDTIPR